MEYERFSSLVAPHTAAMVRAAAALVGTADAEDATQEALLRAWRHWPSLRDADAVHAWLLRITVNVCRNWQAAHFGTTRRLNDPLVLSERERMPVPKSHPGDAPDADALDLRQAITLLPEDLRRVVSLRFYAGMDSTQIGAALDVPAATIRTRLRRALELLRRELDAHDTTSAPSRREGIPNG
ncbi:MAG: RNA polymerase sigma factor [Nitrososphaerota archaeon]